MKRSDMLEIISDALQPCNSTYKVSRDKTAERILDIIEKFRMEPPQNGYTVDRYNDYERIPNYKWEAE